MKFFRRLGVGLGKMSLLLPRQNFVFGERVVGEVLFKLDEPTECKGLVVTLGAYRDFEEKRGEETRRSTKTLYQAEDPLGGPGEYTSGKVRFAIDLPFPNQDLKTPQTPDNPLFVLLSALAPGPQREPIYWKVTARLSIPWSKSLSDSSTIYVGEPEAAAQSYCPGCGSPLGARDRFCSGCGRQLN